MLAIVSAEVFAYDVLHVSIEDPLAVVTCQERSTNIEHGHTNELLSTNVLILDCGGWRVLHRHVSWRATREILAYFEQKIEELRSVLAVNGCPLAFHRYPGAGHWFLEEERAAHHPAAAELAWSRTLSFLCHHLAPEEEYAVA